MKELLKFTERNSKGKTKIFEVYSAHSGDYLGNINWRTGWRCYVMSYANNIDMSISCHDELNNFMKKLEKERTILNGWKDEQETNRKNKGNSL